MERTNQHDQPFRNGSSGVKYLFRGPNIDWGVVRFAPGEQLGPHLHNEVEETFYFPDSEPLMIVAGKEYRVRKGDAFRIPPGEPHNIVNDTGANVDAVFIKSSYRPKDKVDLPG
jgi:mannose-6-phosphate isomerase-like protein (cupin superfamily)